MPHLVIYIFCFFVGAFVTWIVCKLLLTKDMVDAAAVEAIREQLNETRTQKIVAEELVRSLKVERQELVADVKNIENQLNLAKENLYNVKSEASFYKEKLETQKHEIESLGQKVEAQFTVLAQNILEDKSKKFSEEQEKNLKIILDPLEKEIKQFKQDIETKHKQESEERISLREQVKNITSLNQTLSEQANKLSETLRLQVKQQGDWGESILEAILENSGLQKDLQYFTQHSSKNDDGRTIRPDVIVRYPDKRSIVIDSKVSLVHYYNMCNAANEDEQKQQLKQLLNSVRNHIDDLSAKGYKDVNESLDFIIMFVPVEPAYIAAMHADANGSMRIKRAFF